MPKAQACEREVSKCAGTVFPPHGYQPTPVNALLANALDLTAPASAALLKNRKNAWIQLAGHPGSFAPAGPNTIWKKQLSREMSESKIYKSLLYESLSGVTPRLYREVEYNGNTFIEIEDLLQHFQDPHIMDIKMGTRTFLESEVSNPKLRPDLYAKMIKVDPSAATAEEQKHGAVTKLRYMQFREKCSSSASLGFRIEAMRVAGQSPNNDLKTVCSRQQVMQTIANFTSNKMSIYRTLLSRIVDIRRRFEESRFFKHHELIGSSLLILFDDTDSANVWMIDFAKSFPVPDRTLSHRTAWQPGNHEDGYLTGLDNLISIFQDLMSPVQTASGLTNGISSAVSNHL